MYNRPLVSNMWSQKENHKVAERAQIEYIGVQSYKAEPSTIDKRAVVLICVKGTALQIGVSSLLKIAVRCLFF